MLHVVSKPISWLSWSTPRDRNFGIMQRERRKEGGDREEDTECEFLESKFVIRRELRAGRGGANSSTSGTGPAT